MHPAPHLRMPNLTLRLANTAIVLCLIACSHTAIGQYQNSHALPGTTAQAVTPSDVSRAAITEGRRLEDQLRWQEAINHYEKTLKKNPGLRECTERLQICRVRFDVTRRYSDRSFMEKVSTSSVSEAFQVLTEVLAKLEVYYVEPVDYYKLALHGTAFLEVALMEKDFLSVHLKHADAQAVENFRKSIHKVVFGRKIQTLDEYKNVVAHVAQLANQQMGLMPCAVVYEYIAGSVGLLDPYSALLTPGEYREVMSQIEGNLIGLGVELWAEGHELRIVDVFRGGPAQLAGLTPEQNIIQVDGQAVEVIGAKRAADLLRGTEGSKVRLVLRNPDQQTINVEVERRRVDVPSVSVSEMVAQGVGYIKITNFQKTTASEVSRSMWTLSQAGMKSVIIDLRRNPGGLLDSAVELADQFLSRGIIVSTQGRNGHENHQFEAKTPAWDIPLVVLIDGDSASASEIFAGAIADHNRGTVVGTTSYGKGSVQGVFHNENGGGGLRLTVSKFYSPKGTPISARGVQPHVVVDEPADLPNELTALKPSLTTARYIAKTDKPDAIALRKAIEIASSKVQFDR